MSLASILTGRTFLLQSIISLRRIKTILPHSIPFLLGRSRAEKTVILRSREGIVKVYEIGCLRGWKYRSFSSSTHLLSLIKDSGAERTGGLWEVLGFARRLAPVCSAQTGRARPRRLVHPSLDPSFSPCGCGYRPCSPVLTWCYAGGMRSITRIMATVLPLFTLASGIPFLQDHTSPVFATNFMSGP